MTLFSFGTPSGGVSSCTNLNDFIQIFFISFFSSYYLTCCSSSSSHRKVFSRLWTLCYSLKPQQRHKTRQTPSFLLSVFPFGFASSAMWCWFPMTTVPSKIKERKEKKRTEKKTGKIWVLSYMCIEPCELSLQPDRNLLSDSRFERRRTDGVILHRVAAVMKSSWSRVIYFFNHMWFSAYNIPA